MNTTSGLRTTRRTWRRSRWKYCAAVVALTTWMLSSAHEREEALDPRRAVLGPLALVPVRQEQDEAVVLVPLVLGGDEVLVDDDLRAVDEVAELRLPHHERLVVLVRVALLVAERGVLAEQRVVDPERSLRPGHSASGMNTFSVLVVDRAPRGAG